MSLESMKSNLMGSSVDINTLKKGNTAFIVVDMVNGFVREGVFASKRVEQIVPELVKLNNAFKDYKKVFFLDSHSKNASEFNFYVEHCIEGSSESNLIEELDDKDVNINATFIKKNSTNGAIEEEFQDWLKRNEDITNFVVGGCITEVCVMQFVLTLLCLYNKSNKKVRIIVPMNIVDTFDAPGHNAELINIFAFNNMKQNGIEVIDTINI